MSDILDALRKAELQREHARGPGLSTQQRYSIAHTAHSARWKWGVAAAFALGVSSAWLLAAYAGRSEVAVQGAAGPVKQTAASAPAPAGVIARPALRTPGPRSQPAAPSPVPADAAEPVRHVPAALPEDEVEHSTYVPAATVPAVQPGSAPAVAPASIAPPPEAAVAAPPQSVAERGEAMAMIRDPFAPTPRSRLAQQGGAGAAPAPAEAAAPVAVEDPVPLLRTLPYRFQSIVPKLVINAQAYAMTVEDRFVIINMKKYGEGEQTVEGVVVEAIREQDIVLNYQGQQFRMQR